MLHSLGGFPYILLAYISIKIFCSIIFSMDPNEKDLLNKTYELVKENNHILRGIRSSNRWASFFRAIYWIVIIGASIGAFYYIQPYMEKALNAYNKVNNDLNNVRSAVNAIPSSVSKAINGTN